MNSYWGGHGSSYKNLERPFHSIWLIIKKRKKLCVKTQYLLKCYVKRDFLKNFRNFTGNYLCWSLFLIKLGAWKSPTLLKRDSTHCFPLKFVRFLKTPILKSICERLLLLTSLLYNISYFRFKIKKAKTWKAGTLKISCYPEFNIKLIIIK